MYAIWLALIPFIAAVLNRFRGGGIYLMPWETVYHKSTQIRRLIWSFSLSLCALNGWLMIILMFSTLTGWGYAVSVAIGAKSGPREEQFWLLDKLADLLTKGQSEAIYGAVWLSLHGFLFGGMAAVLMDSYWPLLWGLMGVCYKVTRDWEYGEIFYGCVQGGSIALYLLKFMI